MAVLLALYTLPLRFSVQLKAGLDDSWKRALTHAVSHGLVFGRDFVFTYGPLGFLATRYTEHISPFYLLTGDLFLASAYCYVFYQLLSRASGWFLILVLAVFALRGGGYPESLFLLFLYFIETSFRNGFSRPPETMFGASTGVLLFFMKVNYGFIAALLLVIILAYLVLTAKRALFSFVLTIAVLSTAILCTVHVDVRNYVRYGYQLIANYADAMSLELELSLQYISALILVATLGGLVVWRLIWQKTMTASHTRVFVSAALFLAGGFLLYKNSFTRSDPGHNLSLFTAFPLLFTISVFGFSYAAREPAKILSAIVVCISTLNLCFPQTNGKVSRESFDTDYFFPGSYFGSFFHPDTAQSLSSQKILDGKDGLIGHASIDIFPDQISGLLLNNLNYSPRPVPQSYTVYSAALDSLNAAYFASAQRPQLIMIKNTGTDNRYGFWDESVTKAVLCLNYDFTNVIAFNQMQIAAGAATMNKYLLLKAKNSPPRWPVFEKIEERSITIGTQTIISFPDSIPVYMTAELEYTVTGKLRSLLYQPPLFSITLFPDAAGSVQYKIVRPIMKTPVLINKLMYENYELKNFFTRELKLNHNIRSFSIETNAPDAVGQNVKVCFYKFANY